MQTVVGRRGNCFAACLASLLEVELDAVPGFMDTLDWWEQSRVWLDREHGWDLFAATPSNPERPLSEQRWKPKGYALLACVPLHPLATPETVYAMPVHAVIVLDGEVAHDPQPRLSPVTDPVAVGWYILTPTRATFDAHVGAHR
jgi:hypothetical protein